MYQKYTLELERKGEHFFGNFKVLLEPGYLKAADVNYGKKDAARQASEGSEEEEKQKAEEKSQPNQEGTEQENRKDAENPAFQALLKAMKKGDVLDVAGFSIKEGETSPPKRYTSGSMILAMENAGQLIEDEELRAQIKGSGIGTSATRAEILKKLCHIQYLALNKKTQVITPTLLGELIFEVVNASIRQLLNPELTASWEKGLTYVAEGTITSDEYMEKLNRFVAGRTNGVKQLNNSYYLRSNFDSAAVYYNKSKKDRNKENEET